MAFIVLVRHGQSEWNLQNRFTGWVDVGLTNTGVNEAIKSGELIAKEGIVNGNIKCSNIVLGGTIIGDIKSEGSVTLKSTSKLKGDISYRKLHIEDGAKFEGQCDLTLDSESENMLN